LTKSEASTTFVFRGNRRHGTEDGRTDVVQRLMRPLERADDVVLHRTTGRR